MRVIEIFENPWMLLAMGMITGVIFVNGWTDAPSAIATSVATGILSFRKAALLAAVFNFLGVLCMTTWNASVTKTMFFIAEFGGSPESALAALCAGLAAIILWAVSAWFFGIPTSESHALAAGLTGAAAAFSGDFFASLGGASWGKLLAGLLLSTVPGCFLGRWTAKAFQGRLPSGGKVYRTPQCIGAAMMAFLHGAQDGQKFIGIVLLAGALSKGGGVPVVRIPWKLMLYCAGVMALGTLLGGRRIIAALGERMVPLRPREGCAADLGCGVCLLISTLMGLPVSTTQAKAAAILGAGSVPNAKQVDWSVAGSMVLAWVLTFPTCCALGFCLTKLLIF